LYPASIPSIGRKSKVVDGRVKPGHDEKGGLFLLTSTAITGGITIIRKHRLIGQALLGFCLLMLPSCAPPSTGGTPIAQIPAITPGMARVWFLRTRDPQEAFGDPIIYANGAAVGRSDPGIAFYHDYPPGTYAFSVQSYGLPTGAKDTVQLAPGTQTYLEILWGGSWLVGVAGGETFFVRTLPPELGPAYLRMLTDRGPPKGL